MKIREFDECMSHLKEENVELHKRLDQLEAMVNQNKSSICVLYHPFFFNSIKPILILHNHIYLNNIFVNLKKKMEDYSKKININVKNMNVFLIN